MTDAELTRISKFLSLVLRHEPAKIGIALDAAGWVPIADLLAGLARANRALTRAQLDDVVATNSKQRFALSPDGLSIRASQGHSVDVDLAYAPAEPPPRLYHGTVARSLPAIRASGLLKMARHHVHLSPDEATARLVGARRGSPVILVVDAAAMRAAGHLFFLSANGVWLVAAVPPAFLAFPS
ncbi:MAG TPA: RNA 2'-phosphotransferase [Kofleriaceae bacterium]|jgi:putative RNA 2'-phosphotransferase